MPWCGSFESSASWEMSQDSSPRLSANISVVGGLADRAVGARSVVLGSLLGETAARERIGTVWPVDPQPIQQEPEGRREHEPDHIGRDVVREQARQSENVVREKEAQHADAVAGDRDRAEFEKFE